MVESTALEMRHTRKGIGGSNPSLSARPCSLALTTGCQTRAQDAEASCFLIRSISSLQSILQNAANCNVRCYPESGHLSVARQCPLSAKADISQVSLLILEGKKKDHLLHRCRAAQPVLQRLSPAE